MWRRVRRVGVRLVILLGCALGLLELWGVLGSLNPPGAYAKDFGQEYLLARVLLDRGIDPYLPLHVVAEHYLGTSQGFFDKTIPTPHPLTAGLLVLPLGLLSYVAAVRVWFVVQLVSLLGALLVLARLAGFSMRSGWLAMSGLLLLAWQPALLDLALGQVTLPIVLLLVVGEWCWLRQRGWAAGVPLGVSLLLKPLAWPWLLVMVRRRAWGSLLAAAVTVLIGYGLVAARLGVEPIADYLTRVLPDLSAGYALERTNTSLWTIGPQLFQATSLAATLLSAAIAAALVIGVWLAADRRLPLWYGLSMATAVSTVINPISWLYYLALVLLPAAHVLAWLRSAHWPARPTVVAISIGGLLSVHWDTWLLLGSVNRVLGLGPIAAVCVVVGFLVTLETGPGADARQSLVDHARSRELRGHA